MLANLHGARMLDTSAFFVVLLEHDKRVDQLHRSFLGIVKLEQVDDKLEFPIDIH